MSEADVAGDEHVYSTEAGTVGVVDKQDIKRTNVSKKQQTDDQSRDDMLYEPVRKIDTYAYSRRKITTLGHTLKRLSHEGNMDTFNEIVAAINNKCVLKKLKVGKCVRSYMELYDIRFTALDAQIEARRLKYDTTLTDSEVFYQMVKIIKFTSNPTVSSMTYLARLGSALSMKSTLDNGLVYLQYAREHSEHVMPCKDTGMVYYIESNLLSQKYEINPTEEMKKEVLNTIERTIAQFSNEADDIRKDYKRMLMLKMAYCFLGLSLFGKMINGVFVSDDDRQSAKKCMDFIEMPDIWKRMESRRKMLFYIAKAEYYRQEKIHDLSLINAKEAERFAQENKWIAELPNILDLISDIEESPPKAVAAEQSADDIIQELLEDAADDND